MKEEIKKDKIILKTLYVLLFSMLIMFLIIYILAIEYMEYESPMQLIVLITTGVIFIISSIIILYVESKIGGHKCSKCKHEFRPTFKTLLFAPHIWTTRYLVCPKCNKKSWCKKNI